MSAHGHFLSLPQVSIAKLLGPSCYISYHVVTNGHSLLLIRFRLLASLEVRAGRWQQLHWAFGLVRLLGGLSSWSFGKMEGVAVTNALLTCVWMESLT